MSNAIRVRAERVVAGSSATVADQYWDAPLAHVRLARALLLGVDAVAVLGVSFLGVGVWGWILGSATPRGATRPSCWLPIVPVTLVLMAAYGLYRRPGRRLRSLTFLDLSHLFHALTLAGLVSLAVSGVLHRLAGTPKLTWSEVVAAAAPALLAVPLVRAGLTMVMDHRSIPRTRVIILGSGMTARRVSERLARFGDIELVGWVDHDLTLGPLDGASLGRHLGSGAELVGLCRRHGVDRVLVALDDGGDNPVMEWFRDLPTTVRVSVVPPFSDVLTWRSSVDELHGLAVIDVAPPAAGVVQRAAKRMIDVVVSSVLLAALWPAIVVIAVVIKRGSPGPVFFRQVRAGREGRPFVVYKFRTMRDGAEETAPDLRPYSDIDGPIFKLRDDPRVTRAGRFLRRFSFDELPQLFNVVRGDMSLVGPRPFPLEEALAIQGWAARRFDVRPGMTGYWQVSGRNDLTFAELQQLDYAYVASWSLGWDLKILWQTPGAVLARRGAY